jgi:hypothetical protein
MNLDFAISLTTKLLSICLFLHGCEIFILSRRRSFQKIWSYQNLSLDLDRGLPLAEPIVSVLFSNSALTGIALLQAATSLIAFIQPQLYLFILLFFTHWIICIRFRGTFNGGSDMMTFVLLIGTLIAHSGSHPKIHLAGLAYITINTIYSYFKSGLSKIRQPEWRQGSALGSFLGRSLLKDIRGVGQWFNSHRSTGLIFCWLVLIFELLSMALVLFPSAAYYYFAIAFIFHFIVYLSFGLNRFFWIWISAWPATLYFLTLLSIK